MAENLELDLQGIGRGKEHKTKLKSKRGPIMAISTRIKNLLERVRASALVGVVAMTSIATAQGYQAENGSSSRGTERPPLAAENARTAPASSFFASERSSPVASQPESRLSAQRGGSSLILMELRTQRGNSKTARPVVPDLDPRTKPLGW